MIKFINRWCFCSFLPHFFYAFFLIYVDSPVLRSNLLIIIFYNQKNNEEICSAYKCNLLQTLISEHYAVYISAFVLYCMSISLSVRPVDQERRQLAVRFYSKWYFTRSGVDVLTRRFRLALNRYINLESGIEKIMFIIRMSLRVHVQLQTSQ